MTREWLMAAIITFSMLTTSAVLLVLGLKVWMIAFDTILDFLNLKKSLFSTCGTSIGIMKR